eukprot:IDg13123t1
MIELELLAHGLQRTALVQTCVTLSIGTCFAQCFIQTLTMSRWYSSSELKAIRKRSENLFDQCEPPTIKGTMQQPSIVLFPTIKIAKSLGTTSLSFKSPTGIYKTSEIQAHALSYS